MVPGPRRVTSLAFLAVVGAFFAVTTSSCSLMLDLEQCTADADCNQFSSCVEGLCRETQRENVTSHISEDTTWTSDKVYVLEDMIMVLPPAVLTIEPGTRIRGEGGGGLVVRPGARLEAKGTREEPIVFTSDLPVGRRGAGDWAGIGLVGAAPTNREDFLLRVDADGVSKPEVGGGNPDSNCGTLKYVRVEFGGGEVTVNVDGEDEELNALDGITLAGCGSDTTVEYVQSHKSADDGITTFGGTVDLRHVVATSPGDAGYVFDTGWQGTGQYMAVQQGFNSSVAFETQNLLEGQEKTPQSNPQIYNFTAIGSGETRNTQAGLSFIRGAMGTFSHGVLHGQADAGVYVEGAICSAHAKSGDITVQNTLFNEIGEDGETYFGLVDTEVLAGESEEDRAIDLRNTLGEDPVESYDGFEGEDYSVFEAAELNNVFGADPGFSDDPSDLSNPSWVPAGENTTGGEIDAPPEEPGFDPTGNFRGAFAPGNSPWTEGWAAYPPS